MVRLSEVLTLPVSGPARAGLWVIGQIAAAAERELYDEDRIVAQLRALAVEADEGRISDEEHADAEARLLDRLVEARARSTGNREDDVVTYREQTRDNLRDELKSRGLSPAGTKAELIARLYEYDEMHQDAPSGGNGDGESGGEQPSGTQAVKEAFADYEPKGTEDTGNGSGNGEEARGTGRSTTEQDTSAQEAEEAGDADDGPEEAEASGNGRRASGRRGGMTPVDAARSAADQLAALTGRRPDSITGLRPTDDGWRVLIELVEVARIPPSTDVLGTYEVQVDDGGTLQLYERVRRYMRAQSGEDVV